MPIKIGENPEGRCGINKFIARSGDGQRGRIVAIKKDGKHAIVLAMNSSLKQDVQWGRLYEVKERSSNEYPIVVREVHGVPSTPDWKIVPTDITLGLKCPKKRRK